MLRRTALMMAAILVVIVFPNVAVAGGIPSAASNRDRFLSGWALAVILIALGIAGLMFLLQRRREAP
jgi:hypothetical protein